MRPPLSVMIVAVLFLAVGVGGFIGHFPRHWQTEDLFIELTEVVAFTCGAFLLLGKKWARWLTLTWMAFHVAISFPELGKVVVHCVIFTAIGYALYRRDATNYFSARAR